MTLSKYSTRGRVLLPVPHPTSRAKLFVAGSWNNIAHGVLWSTCTQKNRSCQRFDCCRRCRRCKNCVLQGSVQNKMGQFEPNFYKEGLDFVVGLRLATTNPMSAWGVTKTSAGFTFWAGPLVSKEIVLKRHGTSNHAGTSNQCDAQETKTNFSAGFAIADDHQFRHYFVAFEKGAKYIPVVLEQTVF